MASPAVINDCLADLATAFPRETITVERLALYRRELADVDDTLLVAATRDAIRTSRFFPLVSELLAACAEHALCLPSEAEAIDQIEARIAWGRTTDTEPTYVHPAVRESLERVGGFWAYKTADNPAVIRGQFLNVYRADRAETLRRAALEPAALPPLPSAERRALEAPR